MMLLPWTLYPCSLENKGIESKGGASCFIMEILDRIERSLWIEFSYADMGLDRGRSMG
jgi:hypothetical protein